MAFETVASEHAAGLGYAIEIERLRAQVGSRDVFDDVALQTTTVFQREDAGWTLVHRRADPSVEPRAPGTIVGLLFSCAPSIRAVSVTVV